MANLSTFKSKIGYGLRPNLFKVTIPDGSGIGSFDGTSELNNSFSFLCRSAGIPAASIGTVEVPFRGRVIKLPGDRTFESWTVTVFADEELVVRGYFEKWLDKLNEHRSGAGYTENYQRILKVDQYKRGTGNTGSDNIDDPHNIIRTYSFINAFPTNISQIDLSYDNNNSIAEYTIEFQYDWWESAGSGDTAGDGDI
jgi:hypothetical protein